MKAIDTYVYPLRSKLLEYLEVQGVMGKSLAKKMKVSPSKFHHIKKGRVLLDIEKWEELIEFTRGYIDKEDLIQYQRDLLIQHCATYNFKFKHDKEKRKITIRY